jgi:DivIVA domain-containing protein
MASLESEFPRVFRGYDPDEVDRAIARLRRELLASKTEFDRLNEEATKVAETTAILELELQQVDTPTFAGFGYAFDRILKRAEKEAAAIVSRAAADAHNLKNATERERAQIIEIAEERAKRITAITETRASEILQDALTRSSALIVEAEASARDIVEVANQEAANARRSSTTEVTQVISTAKREAEKIKASAQREVSELKLVLVKNAEASGTKINKMITEILRIDTDAAVHRDEAEQEYLTKHNEAVHSTSIYIEESQNELKSIRAQAKVAQFQAREAADKAARDLDTLRAAVDKRALAVLAGASESAARMTETAERLAADIRVRAEAQAQALLTDTDKQREALSKMFAELGELATGAAKKPAAQKAQAKDSSATNVKAEPQKSARAPRLVATRSTK